MRLKVGFVLLSARVRPIPSTRVAVLNILPWLQADGIEPHIVFEPDAPTETPQLTLSAVALRDQGFDVICFQKVSSPSVLALVAELRGLGIKTVFMVCDVIDPRMAEATDATVVISQHLKSLYPVALQGKLHVVHDGIERPEVVKTAWREDRGSAAKPLHAVLVNSGYLTSLPVLGLPPPWLRVSVIGAYPEHASRWHRLRELQWRVRQQPGWAARLAMLRFLNHPGIDRLAWHPDRVYAQLQGADIAIIPIATPGADQAGPQPQAWAVKSENRLTLKMSIGLPVVATPIPAYRPVVEQGQNGFLATTRTAWLECLQALRDPGLRYRMGISARASVVDRFSKESQAGLLASLLRTVIDADHSTRR